MDSASVVIPELPPGPEGLDADLPCPECDYNLRGLRTPRCPECGYIFRWDDVPRLLERGKQSHTYKYVIWGAAFILLITGIVYWPIPVIIAAWIMLVGMFSFVAWLNTRFELLFARLMMPGLSRRHEQYWWLGMMCALVVTFLTASIFAPVPEAYIRHGPWAMSWDHWLVLVAVVTLMTCIQAPIVALANEKTRRSLSMWQLFPVTWVVKAVCILGIIQFIHVIAYR